MADPRDDSTLIDEAEAAPSQGGASGGDLATDIGSRDEESAVAQPEGRTRVTKQDDIAHEAEERPDRPRAG